MSNMKKEIIDMIKDKLKNWKNEFWIAKIKIAWKDVNKHKEDTEESVDGWIKWKIEKIRELLDSIEDELDYSNDEND